MNPVAEKQISIVDIAKAAGVSHTTVSFVLNRRPGKTISEKTKSRVLNVARELGYSPNLAARSLRQGRTNMVAVWTSTVRFPVFAKAVDQIDLEARKHGYMLMIGESGSRDPNEMPSITDRWPVDCIIAYDRPTESELYLKSSRSRKPLVSLGPSVYPYGDYVKIDLYTGFLEALDHLLEIGCKRIAFLGSATGGGDRMRAYEDVAKRERFDKEVIDITCTGRAQIYELIRAHVQDHGVPDGLLCLSDEISIAANCLMHDLGIDVPGRTAIVGADGIDELESQRPTLTSVEYPFVEACEKAWEFVANRMENPGCTQQTAVFNPVLVKRQSTAR